MVDRINEINDKILITVLNTNFNNVEHNGIYTGKLGVVLYLLSLYEKDKNTGLEKKIKEIVEQIFDDLSTLNTSLLQQSGIYDGLAGLGYVLFYLQQNDFIESDFNEQIGVINSLVIDQVHKMLEDSFFDFFYGVIGVLHYLDYVKQDQLCELIINRLLEYGLQNQFIYYNITGDPYSEGLNFGFAHGSSALVAVLLNLHQRGICLEQTEQISKGILNNMLNFRKDNLDFEKITLIDTPPANYITEFPYNVVCDDLLIEVEKPSTNSHNKLHYSGRLGWCNSDLNVLLILFRAAEIFKDYEYKHIALSIIDPTVIRVTEKKTKVQDSFMCHGAAGITMLYRKLYQISNDVRFRDAYQVWIEKTIAYLEIEYQKYCDIPQILQLLTGWLGPSLELRAYLDKTNFLEFEKLFLCNHGYE